VDWNNDGKNDLLVGDGLSHVYLFLNTSENGLAVFNDRTLLINENGLAGAERITPVSFDWNNDGNIDIIAGGMDGYLKVYINKGTGPGPLFDNYFLLHTEEKVFDAGSRSAPRIYDFNDDGLMDILVGEFFGYVYYLKNVGTPGSPVFKRAEKLFLKNGDALKYPGSKPRSRLDIADWNNDGLDDILVGGEDGRVMLFLGSHEKSVPFPVLLNRVKARSIESLIKIKERTKVLLRSVKASISSLTLKE
jgi:hypothetical protein